jgi:hypothetical protein
VIAAVKMRVQEELGGPRAESDRRVEPLGALIHEMADAAIRLGLVGFQVARDLDVAVVVDPQQAAVAAEDEAAAIAFDRELAEAASRAGAEGDPTALLRLAYPPGTAPEDMKVSPQGVGPRPKSPFGSGP